MFKLLIELFIKHKSIFGLFLGHFHRFIFDLFALILKYFIQFWIFLGQIMEKEEVEVEEIEAVETLTLTEINQNRKNNNRKILFENLQLLRLQLEIGQMNFRIFLRKP